MLMADFKAYANNCRRVIPEGLVLLEHDGALPLNGGESIALFGRGQFEYVKSGTGSGGRVNCPYVTNIHDELAKRVSLDSEITEYFRNYVKENPYDGGDGWKVPKFQEQPFVDEELIIAASKRQDKAIFVLCRTVGEGFDCHAVRGEWYLTEAEEHTISLLAKHFKHLIVVYNGGNIIDMSWVKKYGVGTVLCVWQGGQEGGIGTVDALMGDATPSGRLSDTVAFIEDYPTNDHFGDEVKNIHVEDIFVGYRYFETFAPDKVLYPFGYGLSYTEFSSKVVSAQRNGDTVTLSVSVKNNGNYNGKEVVQIYSSAPCGKLGKPARELVTFKKTKLLAPNEEQTLDFTIDVNSLASYDDSGDSGYAYAYVLEAGEYSIYAGENVRAAKKALTFNIDETRLVRQCTQALAPVEDFSRMTAKNGSLSFESAPTAKYDIDQRIKEDLPQEIELTGDRGITLKDVENGNNTLDEFIAQFSPTELMYIIRGEGMSSPKAPVPGTASCFGGVTKVWNSKGVPVITTCDGPSGIRMESMAKATCIPTGTLLACTWNPAALNDLFDSFAEELLSYNVDIVLAPGMNIHRSPLCGRNFEYFSEDPVLTGSFATKIAERFTNKGVYCTLKHFAVNSQELRRKYDNEVLSERALREIYLRGFEMAVKSGYARAIMTAYNRVNGNATGACYDLTTTILRGEWGYEHFVMTDWWPRLPSVNGDEWNTQCLAKMVKAQNDVYMCQPDSTTFVDDMPEAFESGYLTLGELQRCAKNLVKFSMSTLAYRQDRKIDTDNLDTCDELVYEHSLADEPLFSYKLPEDRYGDKPRQRVIAALPDDACYCAELVYNTDGDALEQRNITIYLNASEPICLTVSGTDGKNESRRFKMYLDQNPTMYFEGEGLIAFKLYKLN